MALAIFDLDNTLIAGDSDHLWGEYLIEQGVVDAALYKETNNAFYAQYKEGTLDIFEYLRFALKPLSEHPIETLNQWRDEFVQQKIKPLLQNKALKCIEKHKAAGDTLIIITATNYFVTEPIAKLHSIEHLLAVIPEIIEGKYTGKITGHPTFQTGKIQALSHWLKSQPHDMTDSYFYSDSINDVPLLEKVDNPIVVDGDERLISLAKEKNWVITSFRD